MRAGHGLLPPLVEWSHFPGAGITTTYGKLKLSCIYLHAYACMCMYMHACSCICMHMHTYACTCVDIDACECIPMHKHAYACTCTQPAPHPNHRWGEAITIAGWGGANKPQQYIYIYIYTYVHVYIYTSIYAHTYICIYI